MGAGALLASCTKNRKPDGNTTVPVTAPTAVTHTTAPASAAALVGVGSGAYRDAIDAALIEVGGLDFVARGDTVLLKVNTNSGDPYPYSTNPELVRYLAERLADRGAKVVVGDRSFWGDDATAQNLIDNGIAAAASDVGAELVAFEDDTTAWVTIPSELLPDWRGDIRVPRVAVEGHVINLPCVKTHFITTYTMALKNALGLVKAGDRARPGNLDSHGDDIYDQIAQINSFVTPALNILDGYKALITGGPTPYSGDAPTIASPGIIAASRDRIAIDAVGIGILRTLSPATEEVTRLSTWNNPMIEAAVAANLGIGSAGELTIAGPTVPDLEALRVLATDA